MTSTLIITLLEIAMQAIQDVLAGSDHNEVLMRTEEKIADLRAKAKFHD